MGRRGCEKGVIEHNTENAWKPTSDNPFYKMSQNWGDTRCGADIIAYMNAFEDPRREAYFEKTGREETKPISDYGLE